MTYYEDEEDYGEDMPPASGKGIRLEIDEHALSGIVNAAATRLEIKLNRLAEAMVQKRLDEIINEAWRTKIAEMAEKAIEDYLTKPRAQTNHYGEAVGGSVTISDNIPKAVKSYLDETVDKDGRPSGYSGKLKRLDWIVANMVTKEIGAETAKAAAAVTEKARLVVQQHVARFISEQMVPAIEVNSKG